MRRLSRPTVFVIGAVFGTTLAALPAAALVAKAAPDPHPNTFDGTSPTLSVQPQSFVIGSSIDAAVASDPDNPCANNTSEWNRHVPLRLTWSGSDATSGIAGYDVWGVGSAFDGYRKLEEGTSATTFDFEGSNYDGTCGEGGAINNAYWVVAKDNRGNVASSGRIGRQKLSVWQETGQGPTGGPSTVIKTGTWTTANCTCFNNGRTLYSTTKSAALSYKITVDNPGETVAVVMEKNTNRGVANISVDGGTATAVNTYASAPTHRVVVWQKSLTPGDHTLKISNAGTSGRSRIDVDAIMQTSQLPEQAPELESNPG